jgi:hypothetical protein
MAKAKPKKLEVVPASEFVQLVQDRLNGMSLTQLREVIRAMEAEVADCVAQGYGVKVGTLVKIEPRYRKGLPRGSRFSPFDGETKMRPAKPESVSVKAQALAGAKRDIPKNLKTKAGKALIDKLPKPA